MISQRCPKCLSNRVRHGYRPTAWWSKMLFRYNLLCDRCNWEFTGFAVPGTISQKPSRKKKLKPTETLAGKQRKVVLDEEPQLYRTASASKK
ncbi:MAG: hypothetical protein ACR2F2_03675 [Pyrinomonadaceae bacterium]